jgi:oligoendopeptidase F
VTEKTVPTRAEVAREFTWNDTSVFEDAKAWEGTCEHLLDDLKDLEKRRGHLGDSAEALADALDTIEHIVQLIDKIYVYASMSSSVDTGNQEAAGRLSKAMGLAGQTMAAVSFLDPELLQIGQETLERWIAEEPRLKIYAHYVEDLFRKQEHVRSAEVEELLGLLADPFTTVMRTGQALRDADFKFRPAVSSESEEIELTQGTYVKIRALADRESRRTAWENYFDLHLAFKNTLASNLTVSIKQNVFDMRARRHASTLEAALFENNIPTSVFHNLIDAFQKNLPTWHRYWRIRRKALGVDKLQPYDIWAPLTEDRARVTYDQAVEFIAAGLAPLGSEYVDVLRRGCTSDRWIDVYPNQGKRAGAFSSGASGTLPFIVMSYVDNIFSLSTLAHELGHSMHSYLTWQTQPWIYCDYSIFVAEVASNFHQAMVRAYLLESNPDPTFQIDVIEEAMSNFHRYFLIMPTLARFELEMHQAVEGGEGLTADRMTERLADLFTEAYGPGMEIDRDRVGIQWASFGHLYADYYVYQYATGIAGAHALANRILAGESGAVEDYLAFLKAGASMYPLDALKLAGVDLTQPVAVEETFGVLASMVDRLEELLEGA